ncbi:hypothetical protein Adt_26292 [Abeliophyllum distichum]|uniref:Glycosyltransferase N-terminal domain-containing protein n=1 Tax=Abeliophyllum distichum TaxID=126358 RepID=A0ABD1RRK0_9LAMI
MLEAKRLHYHSSEFFVSFHTSQNGMAVAQVAVMMVPLPAQGHLNQLLHLFCLISLLTTSLSSLLAPPPTTRSIIADPTCLCTNHKSKSLPNNYFANIIATHHYTPNCLHLFETQFEKWMILPRNSCQVEKGYVIRKPRY